MTARTDRFIGIEIEGKYEVLRLDKTDGTARLYEGKEISTDRPVDIQVLYVGNFSEVKFSEFFARFEVESQKRKQLDHPNIIAVEYCGCTDDFAYLVMPRLAGISLKQELSDHGALSASRVGTIVQQVANALEAAKELEIMHGQLTSESISLHVAEDGTESARVHDLGMVKIIGRSEDVNDRLTQHGDTLGSPDYIAPEQVKNLPATYATDLYTLGILTYEMLSGQPPFKAPTQMALMVKHLTTPPPPLAEYSPEIAVSQKAEDAIFKALAKEPSERPESATVYAQELCSALAAVGDPPCSRSKKETPAAPQQAAAANIMTAPRSSSASPSRGPNLYSGALLLLLVVLTAYVSSGTLGTPGEVVEETIPTEETQVIAELSVEERTEALVGELEQLIDDGKFQEAVDLGDKALKFNFGNAFVHYLLGRGYFGLQNEGKAILHLRYAKMLEPESALYRLTLERFESRQSKIGQDKRALGKEVSTKTDHQNTISTEIEGH